MAFTSFEGIEARLHGSEDLSRFLRDLSSHDIPKIIPKAIQAGIRDASRAGSTRMAREVGAITPVKAARLKDDVSVELASDGQSATIWASTKPMSALQFRPRQLRKGLALTFYKGERTIVRSGFMQVTRAASARGKLPFKPVTNRPYSYDADRTKPRHGMEFVQGLSLASIYLGGKHSSRLQAAVEERVSEALVNGVLRRLGSMARGYGRS